MEPAPPLVLIPDENPALGRDECLERLAAAAGPDVFAMGTRSDLSGGVAIGLNQVARRYRAEPEVWALVGEYLRAMPPRDRPRYSGRPVLTPGWVASQGFLETVIAARAWRAKNGNGHAERQDGPRTGAAPAQGSGRPPTPPAALAPPARSRMGAVPSEAVDYTHPDEDPAERMLRD